RGRTSPRRARSAAGRGRPRRTPGGRPGGRRRAARARRRSRGTSRTRRRGSARPSRPQHRRPGRGRARGWTAPSVPAPTMAPPMAEPDRTLSHTAGAPAGADGAPRAPRDGAAAGLLAGLHPAQADAVTQDGGPLLVVAGAASGKTRALPHRTARLSRGRGVSPFELLAITFTTKAADEMKARVAALVGPVAEQMWVSSFHSACVRIL